MSNELNITMNDSWQKKEYIYLDWNVFKYMSEPREKYSGLDKEMFNIVKKLKQKYIFPYSEGHIKDRSTRFSEEHRGDVEKDFAFAESITDQYLIIPSSMLSDLKTIQRLPEIIIAKEPMLDYFNAYLSKAKKQEVNSEGIEFDSFIVNMNAVDDSHPLYEFLLKNNGKVTADGLNDFLDDMFYYFFDDINAYKNIREYTKKLIIEDIMNQPMEFKAHVQTDRLLYYMCPMIEAIKDDENTLTRKWKSICERWLSMNCQNPSFEQLMKEGYALLDFHPLFNDKLKKGKNTADNIVRDGNHCYYASRAKYFVSEDEKTRKKTEFMYKAFGIKTKVVSEDEFVQTFDVA